MKCKQCNKETRLPHHKFCSRECYWETLRGIRGENSPNYKKVVGKSQVHRWLEVHYGKHSICENPKCKHESEFFDWAKKTGKKYERKRENFLRLCRSCHRRYDLTPKLKKKAVKNLWWNTGTKIDYAKGEESGMSKLKTHEVLKIRELYKKGKPTKELSKRYNTHIMNIRYIINGQTWKHLM